MKRSHKILVAVAGFGAALAVAGYFHFHDDPPPDLSRFPAPVYDAEAYAESKKLADAFLAKRVEFKPKEPGDIDEVIIEDPDQCIIPRALRNDPIALRCLRREIEENKEAIPLAEKLLTAPRWVWHMPQKDNPYAFDSKNIPAPKAAAWLLSDAAILKMMTGEPDEAWRIAGVMVEKSRRRHETAHSLVSHLSAVALDGLSESLIAKLSRADTGPKRIGKAFALLDKTTQEAADIRRAWIGEMYLFKRITDHPDRFFTLKRAEETDAVEQSLKNLGAHLFNTKAKEEKPSPFIRWIRIRYLFFGMRWTSMNILPNATMTLLANKIAVAIDHPEKIPPVSKHPETFFFCRNAGGKSLLASVANGMPMLITNGHRNRAVHDLARIAVGVRLYQLSHDGKNPATLSDLVPGVLPEIPRDPFGDQPFRYDAKTGKAWSIGPDLLDDGGKSDDDVTVN